MPKIDSRCGDRLPQAPATRTTAVLLALTFGSIGWLSGQDLLPRDVRGDGARQFEFGAARKVRGWTSDESPVLLPSLAGVVVTGSEQAGSDHSRSGVEMRGLTVDDLAGLADELAEWVGRPLTMEGLDRLTEVILRHYEDHDRPVNEVTVPPQDLPGGVLRVEVVEGRIGRVGIGQSQHFDNARLARGILAQEGDLLSGSIVQADLDWLSRNPFRRANLFAAPGEGVSADLLLQLEERRPWRIYAGYDNSGTRDVGENRWFAGFNWGNAFGLDHVLGYQFTTGDSLDDFQAHAASWELPFHHSHTFLRLAGGWVQASSAEAFDAGIPGAEGTSWQIGLMLGTPLPRAGGWKQEVAGGIEFKRADNFFAFGVEALPGTEVEILQLRADWQGERTLGDTLLQLNGTVVASPGDLTGRNGEDDFEAFRHGAKPTYLYGRLAATWQDRRDEGWGWKLHGDLQLASGALLPTEQLALGGSATVRGYSERILLADSGYAIRAELSTPALAKDVPRVGRGKIHGVLFLDHGLGWREGDGAETLTGAGVGARLHLDNWAEGRLDVAWGLEGGEGAELHAGIFLAF